MEQKELNKILESHERWLQRKGGKYANLTEANLIGADLRWANLNRSNLTEANLTGADLTRADLTGADLTRADLRWANFMNVIGLSVLCVQVNTSCENRTIAYIPSLNVVTAGCFQGTFAEFEKRVEEEHRNNPFILSRYRRIIAFLKREAEEDRAREKEMATVDEERR